MCSGYKIKRSMFKIRTMAAYFFVSNNIVMVYNTVHGRLCGSTTHAYVWVWAAPLPAAWRQHRRHRHRRRYVRRLYELNETCSRFIIELKYRISYLTQLLTRPRRMKMDNTRNTLCIIRAVLSWHANEVHVTGHRSSELTWPAAGASCHCVKHISGGGGHPL